MQNRHILALITNLVCVFALYVSVGRANAQLALGLGSAKQFNAVVFGNANTQQGGHSDAGVAVQGNWSGQYEAKQSSAANTRADLPGFSNIGILVNGQVLNSGNGLRSNHGNLYYNELGSKGKILIQNPYVIESGVRSDFFERSYAEIEVLQASLARYSSLLIDTSDRNQVRVDMSQYTTQGSLTVLTLSASALAENKNLIFSNVLSTDMVVINVYGQKVDWKWSVNGIAEERLLWNFVDAQQVNVLDREFSGSLLAPGAEVNQYRDIKGTLIANDWNVYGNNKLIYKENQVFVGDLPVLGIAPIPEPSSLLLAAFGVVLLFRRKR